jgi:hypothetical protein
MRLGVGIALGWRNGTSLVAPPVGVSNQTAFYGALTPAGAGGFEPFDGLGLPNALTGTVTRVGGPALTRTWTINGNGDLVANGTPGVDHGVVLRCTLAAGGTVDITIDASTYSGETVGLPSEWDALSRSDARLSGRTHLVRCRDFDNAGQNATGQWPNAGAATLRAERIDVRKPRILGPNGQTGFVGGAAGLLTFKNIHFYAAQGTNWNWSNPIPTKIILAASTRGNIIFDACEVSSNLGDTGAGAWMTECVLGLEVRTDNVQLINCEFHHLFIGVRTAASTGNVVSTGTIMHHLHGDNWNTGGGPILVTGGGGHSRTGMGNMIHPDFYQINGAISTTVTYEGRPTSVLIEGVTVVPGAKGIRRPGEDPVGGLPNSIATVTAAVSTSLSYATHAFNVTSVTAINVALTLPLISSVAVDTEFVISVGSFTGTTILGSGADTYTGGSFPVAVASGGYIAFTSNGTAWEPKFVGTRTHHVVRTADYVCDTKGFYRTHIFKTAAAGRTLTLPASPADGDEVHAQVFLDGQNPVTVLPNAGQGMIFGGSIVASHVIPTIARSSTFRWDNVNTRWIARGSHFGDQWFFSNANSIAGAVIVRGNIGFINETWWDRIESTTPHSTLPPFHVTHHNAAMPYMPVADWNGDGFLDDGDGSAISATEAQIETRGPTGKPMVVWANFANRIEPATSMTHTEISLIDNDISAIPLLQSQAGNPATIAALMNYTYPWPTTLAEGRTSAQLATGRRVGQYWGPHGFWNFTTGARNAFPAMTASMLAVYDAGTVRVRFSQPIWPLARTGTVTLFNVTDGVTVETFDVAVSPLVVVLGDVVTITPTTPLTVDGKTYSVRFAATCFPSVLPGITLAVADNSLSFVTLAIVYPTIVSRSNSVTVATTNQFESATFTLTGATRYVLHIGLRSTTTADPVAVFTRGAAGRAYGTGTTVVPDIIENHFSAHSYAILVDPGTSPGAETIQVTTTNNCNFAAFEVIEVVNATAFGTEVAVGITSAAPSTSITTQSVYSTILGLPVVNAGIVSAGGGNTALYVRTAQTIHSYAAITQTAVTAAAQTYTIANTASAQTALCLVELRST